jgi:hypothetical protein
MDDRFLGHDLDLGFLPDEDGRRFAGPYAPVDLQSVRHDTGARREFDLGRAGGRANLVQSLILRLKTERGELAPLGYPDYGSRHLALVGEPNTERTRTLIKLYVLECLRQEPRLEAIKEVTVQPWAGAENRDKVRIEIRVKARGLPDPLSLVVPFSFEGEVG